MLAKPDLFILSKKLEEDRDFRFLVRKLVETARTPVLPQTK